MRHRPRRDSRACWRVGCLLVVALLAASCQRDTEDSATLPMTADQTPAATDAPGAQTEPAATESAATEAATSEPATIGLATTELAPGDYTISVRHDGRRRSYIVHVPVSAALPTPVMIALHGGGGTGADFQDQNGLDAVADREGFLAVYPEGTGILPNRLHTWNSGVSCCGYALDRQVDDVDFLRDVIADLGSRHSVDTGRVYMTGHSNGAMMAYRFAAEASELVTAIVPVAGAADIKVESLPNPVAVLHIHSLDDPRALYPGGEGPPFPGTDRTVTHEPVLPGVQTWASLNGCAASASTTDTTTGSGDNAGHTLSSMTWPSCRDGVSVQHDVLSGSGHGWPGVTAPRAVQRHLGATTTLLNASEAAWAFASQFER